jgi:hypothetical protein
MSLTIQKYTPEIGLKDKVYFPTTPTDENAARKQFQDLFDQMLAMHNTLLQKLGSTEDGDSGADNIAGTPITGVDGSTVQEMLEDLKQQQVELTLGEVNFSDIAQSGDVTEDFIGTGAVTNGKIGSRAVTKDKIALANDGGVGTVNIDDGAVGTQQLAQLAVTPAILDTDAVITAKIKDANVTNPKLAADAVTTAKIADGNVTAAKIADATITGSKIAVSTVALSNLDAATQAKLAAERTRLITISSSSPSGGSDGDVWIKLI